IHAGMSMQQTLWRRAASAFDHQDRLIGRRGVPRPDKNNPGALVCKIKPSHSDIKNITTPPQK
ncbi:hypothetical protein, partial [Enterobacter asburiae]